MGLGFSPASFSSVDDSACEDCGGRGVQSFIDHEGNPHDPACERCDGTGLTVADVPEERR